MEKYFPVSAIVFNHVCPHCWLSNRFDPQEAIESSKHLLSTLESAHTAVPQQTRTTLWQEVQNISYAEDPTWMPIINLSARLKATE